ncbi:21 kDa subunit of NADH dehydrogenase [Daldinia decipiens]|uniref:21 kDa subunit of NADH dehydrogenase n=1 Tax=Daldinia decipiens TaxID=326647 RepID=UPI0020C26AA0|nr:21 kDa subunit of NADH dehydrogenase [Daldinia decipiens]KAI1662581.1 21 kDa subunit of NADH dehydrogenase [Daldinia decipiens]
MASNAVAKAVGGVVSISQKQTLQSTGIWERIRRAFAVDPNRSNGIPLNPHYRNPTPGGQDPLNYDDPVTIPAGDIADNPYWKRDARRAYPKLSFVTQGDAVALLTVGSAAAPKQELIGEAGQKQLVAAQEDGRTGGLAAYFEKSKDAARQTLFVGGLPPLPSGEKKQGDGSWKVHDYALDENSYPESYPCRSFK